MEQLRSYAVEGLIAGCVAVAEVPKHEIRSPHDWLFPPGISSRTDSYNPSTGTPDRLTFSLDFITMSAPSTRVNCGC